MNQMPLHFSYHSSKTLEKHGAKTIHVRKMLNGIKRATGAFIILTAGNFLMPMIIFKGKPDGHVTKKRTAKIQPLFHLCMPGSCVDEYAVHVALGQPDPQPVPCGEPANSGHIASHPS
jgi:hypothetical protein